MHLLPEYRTDLVSHQPIKDPPGLLGFVFIDVQLQGVLNGRDDGLPGQVVEEDPVDLFVSVYFARHVPRDGLPLAVGVGRQKDGIRLLRRFLQFGDDLLLFGDDLIDGLKVIVNIDPQLAFGKVFDVSDRGLHLKFRAKVFLYGLHLGWGFNDNKRGGHGYSFITNFFPGSCSTYPFSSRDMRVPRRSCI